MSTYVSLEMVQGVARLSLDTPDSSVNLLSTPALEELDALISRLEQQSDLTAVLIVSDKAGGFVAGADISEIEGVTDPAHGVDLARSGQRIFSRLEKLKVPVIAALHGHCMGGGTELALACHYRIAADNLVIALPETRLGIIPGFGGTQRLPRLVPLKEALDMILSGRTLRAAKAEPIGLVDRVVPLDKLSDSALDFARQVAADPQPILSRRKMKAGGLINWLMRTPPARNLAFRVAKAKTLHNTGGHYPAPFKAIDVLQKTFGMPLEKGLEIEAKALGELIVTTECKNLIHVFNLSQRHRKVAPAKDAVPPKQVAVLGAGVMGSGIAQLVAENRIAVILKDIDEEAVARGLEIVRKGIADKFSRQGKTQHELDKLMSGVTGTIDFELFGNVDLVIEAVVENLEVKRKVTEEVEKHLPDTAIFASNTSALSVTTIQQSASRPSQVGGLHFFNPVNRMPLVEVIRGESTSDATLNTLFAFADELGKIPITVDDRPGFLVNRLLMAYLNEALLLSGEGYDWVSIDHDIKAFGLPMGPFRLIDEVGIDVAAEVGHTLCEAFSYLQESPLLKQAEQSGLLGKKGGSGFYNYEGKTLPNDSIDTTLGLSREREPGEDQLQRMLYLMVNEAARCLEEGVVTSAHEIDTGTIFGIGFPPFRGGLCRWADNIGIDSIANTLERLSGENGERFEPCGVLRERNKFYP